MFARIDIRRATVALSALAAAVALALGMAPASPGDAPPRHCLVQPGQSLWDIAQERYPGSDPREAVYRIEQANGLRSAVVEPGQRLVLP
jgi:Tfp pilus assembly protein FimV